MIFLYILRDKNTDSYCSESNYKGELCFVDRIQDAYWFNRKPFIVDNKLMISTVENPTGIKLCENIYLYSFEILQFAAVPHDSLEPYVFNTITI